MSKAFTKEGDDEDRDDEEKPAGKTGGSAYVTEEGVRALHADYVVDCPPYPIMAGPGSFGVSLRKGPPPSWLENLSSAKSTLKIYRVLPAKGGDGRNMASERR